MRKYLCGLVTLLLLSTAGILRAETGFAKYAGEFMSVGVGARALGMGGTGVTTANDVTAAYWNPAGLIGVRYPQISLMHASRFSGIVNYNYGGAAIPLGELQSLAVTLTRTGVDDIKYTALENPHLPLSYSNRPYVSKTVSDAEYAFYVSYARLLPGKLSLGINMKVIHKGIGDNAAWGIGFDIGILANPFANLLIGANLQDATTTLVAWDTQRNELIAPTLKMGASYPVHFKFWNSKLVPATDIDFRLENYGEAAQLAVGPLSADLHLGIEYTIFQTVAFRIGHDRGTMTAGAGFRLPRLNIDYAFMQHNQLGDTHRISMRLTLENNKIKRH
ncbi:PorV/PorQ family protein [bacterium]|nr:PorV/PorQ family protein [bacterium]